MSLVVAKCEGSPGCHPQYHKHDGHELLSVLAFKLECNGRARGLEQRDRELYLRFCALIYVLYYCGGIINPINRRLNMKVSAGPAAAPAVTEEESPTATTANELRHATRLAPAWTEELQLRLAPTANSAICHDANSARRASTGSDGQRGTNCWCGCGGGGCGGGSGGDCAEEGVSVWRPDARDVDINLTSVFRQESRALSVSASGRMAVAMAERIEILARCYALLRVALQNLIEGKVGFEALSKGTRPPAPKKWR